MFKAIPFLGSRAKAAKVQTNGTGGRTRSQSPDASQPDPHEVGADGWLTAYDVKKSYKKRMVVKGVSLAVGRGESVGLLGPNGAGKTTVFYMITGLVPADHGRITIDGENVTRLPMYQRARLGIGYLPQEASIFRGLTVEQNIMAVLELVEPDKKARKEQLDSLLEEFSITRLRKSPSMALSGGDFLSRVIENSSSRLSSCSLRAFLSGSTSSSTAIMFCSTVKPRKIEASWGR